MDPKTTTASSASSSASEAELQKTPTMDTPVQSAAADDGAPMTKTKSWRSRNEGAPEVDYSLQHTNSYTMSVAGHVDDPTPSPEDGGDLEKKVSEPKGPLHPDSFPDGGLQAWLTVAGAFCSLFVSFGWINAIGIFQQAYQTEILTSYSPGTIAWIVSLETFFMFFGGPFLGLLFDNYGPRPLLLGGTVLHVAGLVGASFGTQYWHFILCQGLISALGASACFYPAVNSVLTWFRRRRGLALGITASGSSLGGVIFPIMVTQLLPKVGFGWTMRACALVILVLLVFANATVRTRFAPTPRRFDLRAFAQPLTQPSFLLLTLSALLIFFGLFIPFTFLPVQSVTVGLSPTLAGYVIPILNAVSIVGRITPGWISDKIGHFNTTIAMTGLCGVLTLALWLPARSGAAVLVYAVGYGFGSGAFVAIMAALVAIVSPDLRQIGTRNGTLFAIISVGPLVGNPIAGALLGPDRDYAKLIIFAGVFLTSGTLLMAVTRLVLTKGKLFAKM